MGRSGYTCVRHVFCSLNVLMWLTGCAILAAGLYLRLAAETNVSLLPQYALLSADSAFIATGVTMFVLAFFGCCGAWFQSHCMLVTYFSLVIFLCLVEFMFGTLAFVFSNFLDRIINDELKDGIKHHYNTSSDNSLNLLWTHIQTELHCCGVKNYEDWFLIDAWPDKRWVPDSCCRPEVVNKTECGKDNSFLNPVLQNTTAWYDNGCLDEVKGWFISRLLVVGIVGIVVTFIQLFGLISSMLLFCTVRHKRHSQTYKSYDPAA